MQEASILSESPASGAQQALTISPEKVCLIIVKAKAHDAEDRVAELVPGADLSDDMDIAVLDGHEGDPVAGELTSLIKSLSEDEQVDLVSLAWLGREGRSAGDWPAVREEAARAHTHCTAEYLLGMPLVGVFLEEGLTMLGYVREDSRIGRT